MLLLIDASRANNEQKTGVEWYAYFVIQELKKIIPSNVEVCLFTREPLKGDLAVLPSNWQEKVLVWAPRRLWTQLRLSWEMLKYKNKKDVVLFVPAHVLPLITPLKTFTTIHDLGGFSFPKGYSFFERWYTKFAIRSAIKKATIFVPSNFIKKELEYFFNKKLNADKIKVVHNGYDKELFKPLSDLDTLSKTLEKYNLAQPYFLSISRLEEKKNTVGIIKAFDIFRKDNPNQKYSLILLGKPGFGFEDVELAIKESEYKNDIKIPGWVETQDVPVLMSGSSVFIFPSFYEGFGIPVLEAMAMGTSVITSAISSMPEVAGGGAILINPNKPVEIAQALFVLTNNPKFKQELIQKGLAQVLNFSWQKTAQEIWENVSRI